MNIIEFKKKKYGDSFVELKKLEKEFTQNEKDKKKYFVLKNKGQTTCFEFMNLKNSIIW